MEHPDSDTETFETIPWSHLAPARTPLATRVVAVVLAIAATVVFGLLLASVLRDDPGRTVVSIPAPPGAVAPSDVEPSGVAPPGAAVPPSEPTLADPLAPGAPPPAAAPDEVRLYSEADLMSVIPEEEQRAVVTRAEWFVMDFFTVDGDPQSPSPAAAALPESLGVTLPHGAAAGVSYVEWARAGSVTPVGPGRYDVDVLFRSLAGAASDPLIRQPVRAVRVRTQIDDDGALAILDLPQPIELGISRAAVTYPAPAEPPPEVVDAATEVAATFGTVGDVLGAGIDEEGWRLVIEVGDASGVMWPMVVRP